MPTIEELKARLGQLNRRTNKANDVWKPKDEHDIRLIRYPFADDPFITLHFHYDVGDASVLCPNLNFGEDCAVCSFAELLKSWKTPEGDEKRESDRKADWEIFKRIQAKARIFVPMVERGKEGEGPKFWGITPNQSLDILKVCLDPDRMSECGLDPKEQDARKLLEVLISPTRAYDLHVSFAKPGDKGNGKTFPQITITGKIRATPLSDSKSAAADIQAKVKNIQEAYPRMPPAEVEKIFKKFVNSSAPEAKAEGGTEKYEGQGKDAPAPTGQSRESAHGKGGRSIDEAFGDLAD